VADCDLHLRIVVSALEPPELMDRITAILTQHVAQCSEGVVPAVAAEEIVTRLSAQDAIIWLTEAEQEDS
jgi:hypothetical protein